MAMHFHPKLKLPRLGPTGTALLILPSFIPEFFTLKATWLLTRYLISGDMWRSIFTPTPSYRGSSPSAPIAFGMAITAVCLFVIVLFMTLSRRYAAPEKRLNHHLLRAASVIHILFLLITLTLPAHLLAHYIVQMGFTPKCVLGIMFHCGVLCFMAVFFYWVMRRPHTTQSRFPVEQQPRP